MQKIRRNFSIRVGRIVFSLVAFFCFNAIGYTYYPCPHTTEYITDQKFVYQKQTSCNKLTKIQKISKSRRFRLFKKTGNSLPVESYGSDGHKIYFKNKEIIGADINTFGVLFEEYSYDKHHIYYQENIHGLSSFEDIKNLLLSKAKKYRPKDKKEYLKRLRNDAGTRYKKTGNTYEIISNGTFSSKIYTKMNSEEKKFYEEKLKIEKKKKRDSIKESIDHNKIAIYIEQTTGIDLSALLDKKHIPIYMLMLAIIFLLHKIKTITAIKKVWIVLFSIRILFCRHLYLRLSKHGGLGMGISFIIEIGSAGLLMLGIGLTIQGIWRISFKKHITENEYTIGHSGGTIDIGGVINIIVGVCILLLFFLWVIYPIILASKQI